MKKRMLVIINECNRIIYQDKLIKLLKYCQIENFILEIFWYEKEKEKNILNIIKRGRIKNVFLLDGQYDYKFLDKINKKAKLYSFDSTPLQDLNKYNVIEIDDLKINLDNNINNEVNLLLIKDNNYNEEIFYNNCNSIIDILKTKMNLKFNVYIIGNIKKMNFKYQNIDMLDIKVHNDYYDKIKHICNFKDAINLINPSFYTIYFLNGQFKNSYFEHMVEFLQMRNYITSIFSAKIDEKELLKNLKIIAEKNKFYQKIEEFYKLPLEEKFIFSSFQNNKYSCNPKYLSEYILKNKLPYKVVWIFNDIKNPSVKELTRNGIKCVEFKSLDYYKEIITSKYIVSNQRIDFDIIKRENQIYIQTWHGDVGLKTVEKESRNTLTPEWIELAKKDCSFTDYNICGSDFGENVLNNYFWYKHNILKIGTFRNDIFFYKKKEIEKIREKFKLDSSYFYILYAPTFRNDINYDYSLNFSLLKKSFEKKFNKKVKFIIKLHPNVKINEEQFKSKDLIIMNDCDIQELLVLSDSLITDYSSVMMDYIITKRPCFLCMKDYNNYIKNNRNLLWNLKELPFVISYSEEDLVDKIEMFEIDNYNKKINNFLISVGSIEDGKSCQRFIDFISKK